MTNIHDRKTKTVGRSKTQIGDDLSGDGIARAFLERINYLRNWRYFNPIFQCAGLDSNIPAGTGNGQLYPIFRNITRRDGTIPDRHFAIVADPMEYFHKDDQLQELRFYKGVPPAVADYQSLILRGYSYVGSTAQTGDYTAPPEIENTIIYTQGKSTDASGEWGPLSITPSAEFDYGLIVYHGMPYRGLGLFEIPNPNMTGTQAGCRLEECDKDGVIRGDVTPRDKSTWGSIADMIYSSTDVVDTVEMATRRHWQWCHPFGVFISTGTGYTAGSFYNMLGNATVKFKPRKIFDDTRKVRVTIAAVITADIGTKLKITNTTHSSYTYTHTVPSLLPVPTLVTLSATTTGLRVARGTQNLFKFECATATAAAIKVHSLAIFEEDPFDSIA